MLDPTFLITWFTHARTTSMVRVSLWLCNTPLVRLWLVDAAFTSGAGPSTHHMGEGDEWDVTQHNAGGGLVLRRVTAHRQVHKTRGDALVTDGPSVRC